MSTVGSKSEKPEPTSEKSTLAACNLGAEVTFRGSREGLLDLKVPSYSGRRPRADCALLFNKPLRHYVKLVPAPLSIDPWGTHLRCLRHLPLRACVPGGAAAAISLPERPPRSSQRGSCSCSPLALAAQRAAFCCCLVVMVVVDISRWRLAWLRCAAMWILGLAACNRCASVPLVGFMLFRQRIVPQQALVFGCKLVLSVVHLLLNVCELSFS